ncbi:MAG: helix-turn-helix domain-containing protein, partial [Bacteroidales bacterium]
MFTNRAYVSKIIKEKYKCSFSDYINGKRINFSMGLMRLSPTLTQDKIAEQAGFINAQSYSRAFKKIIGIPPKEWLNRNVYP